MIFALSADPRPNSQSAILAKTIRQISGEIIYALDLEDNPVAKVNISVGKLVKK